MSEKNKKYRYSVCKSSWGISICIIGDLCESSEISKDEIRVSDKLFLVENLKWLNESEKSYLLKGLRLAFQGGYELDEGKVILLKSIDFNFTDYQENALGVALAGWVASAVNIDMVEFSVSYNSLKNKYQFLDSSGCDLI